MRWFYWLVLAFTNLAVLFGGRLLHKRYKLLSADRLALIAGVLSVDVFLVLRVVILDVSRCAQPVTLACVFNENLGVLTFGVLLVAATTMYLNIRVKQADERQAETSRRSELMRMLKVSMDEIAHNVQHFAYEIDDSDKFLSFPATTFEATFALLEEHSPTHLRTQIITRLSDLRRILAHNRATLSSAAEASVALRPVALLDLTGIVRLSGAHALSMISQPAQSETVQESTLARIRFDERVLTHSVRFLMEAVFFHQSEVSIPRDLRSFQWLEVFLQEMRDKGNYCYFHKASEVKLERAVDLRAKGSRLFCWIKDRDVEGVEVIGLRTSFRDLYHRRH